MCFVRLAIRSKKDLGENLSQISVAVYLVYPYFLKGILFDRFLDNIYDRQTLLILFAFGLPVLVSSLLNKKIKHTL
jgi:hypothetical protein